MVLKFEFVQMLFYCVVNVCDGLLLFYQIVIVKLVCNQVGFDVVNEVVQVMGGFGYSQELLVEYCMCWMCGWMIVGGLMEIFKNCIVEFVFDCWFDQCGQVECGC